MTSAAARLESVTCLGCGCACDDIVVHTRDGRIVQAERACPRGAAWFGDGGVPTRTLVSGAPVPLERAIGRAAELIGAAEQVLVCLGADLSCEAHREGVAIADLLRARIDVPMSASAVQSVLASQRRGRAGATLGEIRNRADTIVFWGVDPDRDYPRFAARYAPGPATPGVHGGSARHVVAVDVGGERGFENADGRLALPAGQETAALTMMRAAVLGRRPADGAAGAHWLAGAIALAEGLKQARYSAIVHDADHEMPPREAASRADALIALVQALNGSSRCALVSLGGGGNRAGAHAVLVWQSGFPLAVDFARGAPRYRPELSSDGLLATGELDTVLLLGAVARAPAALRKRLAEMPSVVVGPRASEGDGRAATVVIDTGMAGIHEGGTALRMDDVPLPLRPALESAPGAAAIIHALRQQLGAGARPAS